MALNREERKLLHQKGKQPTFGSGKPDKGSGNEGDIAYRKIEGSGTVQFFTTKSISRKSINIFFYINICFYFLSFRLRRIRF